MKSQAKQRTADRYQAANQTAAEIILSDIEHYGEESLPLLWARPVLAKAEERTAA